MKYLHVTNTDKFVLPYIKFINKHFDQNSHKFAVIINNREESFNQEVSNIEYFKNKNKHSIISLSKLFYQYDGVYIHGLFNSRVILLLFLQPWLLRKCSWIVWGADLYSYREPKKTIKSILKEITRKKVIKNFRHVCTLVKKDYEIAKEVYNVRGEYLPAMYLSQDRYIAICRQLENATRRKDNIVKILIGNSATKSNHHIEVLELLKRFSHQNIEIYCPLSYGDSSYANEVIEYGTITFKEKFKPIIEFMNMDTYIELLDSMDIGIFNNDRQQGLGNINSLLHLGKKVYLREGTTMWNEIHEEKKFVVYPVEMIKSIEFEELNEFSNEDRIKNKILMEENYSERSAVDIWRRIFNEK
ncbi:TDP-N-acetylfucosamine:lipid II N-acetylfucosaminyltransferase [Lederbergia graminis]|uniref:TDP-N-acetylfucosamine:lipid II N-acetylfucosaminyltransferase n=1 Tax=Lederbergia graminis TaxID=735518 RepID=A0ABW0LJX5_9BACI